MDGSSLGADTTYTAGLLFTTADAGTGGGHDDGKLTTADSFIVGTSVMDTTAELLSLSLQVNNLRFFLICISLTYQNW